jgi:two-component system KDP operon response regulator KdpE
MVAVRSGDKPRGPSALLVEDEPDVLDLLARLVEQAGIAPLRASKPVTALELLEKDRPSVAVVDLNLRPFDGIELIVELRRRSAWLPIIVLTARGSEEDKVRALDAGADDYVVKPFGHRELIARVRAHLRRGARDRETQNGPSVFEIGPLRMKVDERVVAIDGQDLHLTAMEFRLLHCLARRSNAVVPTSEIAKQVWGYDDAAAREVVRVTLSRLRRKIGDNAASPRLIHTVPGVGVRLRPPSTS